jgi:hypothetical protein
MKGKGLAPPTSHIYSEVGSLLVNDGGVLVINRPLMA